MMEKINNKIKKIKIKMNKKIKIKIIEIKN